MAVETMELDHTAQRLVFINPTRAMECLLPALLTNMPHLLPLEDLEALLFMAVIVLWVEVWVTMVVLDLLSQLKLPKDLEAVAHSVVLMIRLRVVHTQAKTNNTTTPIKVPKLGLVMT